MNASVAVCLGVAAWIFMCAVLGSIRGVMPPKSIGIGRFVIFIVALGFAAHWWTP